MGLILAMKKKRNSIVLVLALIIVFSGCQNQSAVKTEIPAVTGTFDFTVLKTGQADAIFMQTENHSIILDCGEKDDGDELVELLQEKGISNVDYIFITHFDKDHVGGFPEVMDNVTASNIIVPNYEGNNDEYEEYLKTVRFDKGTVLPSPCHRHPLITKCTLKNKY